MSIQDLLNQISDFKEKKSYYEKLIQAFDRIDQIEVHFKKTKDFIGNYGYAEGNDSFSFVLDDSRKDEFYNMQKTFMDTIEYKYKIYDAKLKAWRMFLFLWKKRSNPYRRNLCEIYAFYRCF